VSVLSEEGRGARPTRKERSGRGRGEKKKKTPSLHCRRKRAGPKEVKKHGRATKCSKKNSSSASAGEGKRERGEGVSTFSLAAGGGGKKGRWGEVLNLALNDAIFPAGNTQKKKTASGELREGEEMLSVRGGVLVWGGGGGVGSWVGGVFGRKRENDHLALQGKKTGG